MASKAVGRAHSSDRKTIRQAAKQAKKRYTG